ncbi:DegT/DnrJ/EryC1/StrS family aminotransferase [Streptomyces bauhiniae]|uniref:DegT/DnrJ/EryC1/StrS family aminotransferase n=1 Tax=Streptomyces bauhiniae TaxID=2340725 RepID=UPI00365EA0F5
MRYPLAKPSLGKAEADNVRDALASGWISGTGPYVSAFERALEHRCGRASAIAVSSGTTGLELVLSALGIGPGDEVIVPALTFAAPAAAVLTTGAVPVLCDIDPVSWTLDPAMAAELLTSRSKAIVAVDLMGHPCDYEGLARLGVPVVEDAAQAHGATTVSGRAGGFGIASVFSFHVNKAVTTGEGGAVVTDDAELADRVRLLAHHGMREGDGYHHTVAGRNGRMTNLSAAVGVAQMERWDELVDGRGETRRLYDSRLEARGFIPRPSEPWASPSCWLYCVTSKERDGVVARARLRGADVRAVWPALSDLPLYRSHAPHPCVHASAISRAAMWLPTWAHMSAEDVDAVVATLL